MVFRLILFIILSLNLISCSSNKGKVGTELSDSEERISADIHGSTFIDTMDKKLRIVYDERFPVGSSVYYEIVKNEIRSSFIADQYSSVTPENEMKPMYIHPEEGVFDWAKADSIVAFAQKNDMKVRGHCLIWHWRMPEWFWVEDEKQVSEVVLLSRMKEHITTVMTHFKGKVYCWDVVNEAISMGVEGTSYSFSNKFYEILGERYIEEAFIIAHNVDPSVKLFYNDNFNENGKKEKIFKLLKDLKSKGIPIDGIGIQGHFGINSFTEESLKKDIALFKSIGLEVQFTEVDISAFEREEKKYIVQKDFVFSSEIEEKQADQYEILFRVSREDPAVTGITMWGGADWPNFLNKYLGEKAYPYLFDEKRNPKKAFFAVTDF